MGVRELVVNREASLAGGSIHVTLRTCARMTSPGERFTGARRWKIINHPGKTSLTRRGSSRVASADPVDRLRQA